MNTPAISPVPYTLNSFTYTVDGKKANGELKRGINGHMELSLTYTDSNGRQNSYSFSRAHENEKYDALLTFTEKNIQMNGQSRAVPHKYLLEFVDCKKQTSVNICFDGEHSELEELCREFRLDTRTNVFQLQLVNIPH